MAQPRFRNREEQEQYLCMLAARGAAASADGNGGVVEGQRPTSEQAAYAATLGAELASPGGLSQNMGLLNLLNQRGPPVAPTGVPVAPPPVGAMRQEPMPSASELERGLNLQ